MTNPALSRRGLLSGAAGTALGVGALTADAEASVLAGTRQGGSGGPGQQTSAGQGGVGQGSTPTLRSC